MTDPTSEERAEAASRLTDAFYESEPLTTEMQKSLQKHQPSPVTLAFALIVLDRAISAQVKDWSKIKHTVGVAFGALDKGGCLPTFNPDGSVTPPKIEDEDESEH